ncbi:ATP-binding protein [Streptomyces microflavus]|uniref:ATP-binding protein n=1 Tax=Streptomyces microflavus TaxID=1919 RepID=UPI0033FF00FA
MDAVFPLGGEGASIADARNFAAAFLGRARDEHGIPVSARAMDTVQLIVSELVTNTRKYAPGPARLLLHITPGTAQITVWDTAPTLPTPLKTDPSRIGQHGLEIVKMLAQDISIVPDPPGKRITVRLPLDREALPTP